MKLTALALLVALSLATTSSANFAQQCSGCLAEVIEGSDPVITPPPAGCIFSASISAALDGHPETCSGTEGECTACQ